MPVIIDDNIVQNLNGPTCAIFLEQTIQNEQLNNNYLILLGDTHSTDNFEPCYNDPNCTELQTDFIKMLNTFASTTRVDFYIEFFLEKFKVNVPTSSRESIKKGFVQEQLFYDNLRNNPELRTLSKNEPRAQYIISEEEKNINKKPYMVKGRSNMTEINSMYASCFYKNFKQELCPYKNIIWQYADARKTNKYNQNDDIESISYSSNFFAKFLIETFTESQTREKITSETITNLAYDADGERVNLIDLLTNIQLVINSSENYIDKLLARPIFQKQLSKMNEEAKSIFTKESFVMLVNKYKDFFQSIDFTGLKTIIDLLLEFINLYPVGTVDFNKNLEQENDILVKLNSLSFENNILTQYGYITFAVGNCAMDIYFILRIYKKDTEEETNKKLVLSYFGSIHSNILAYYFTDIVKTHITNLNIKSPENLRRISIPDTSTIDLNKILQHEIITQTSIVSPVAPIVSPVAPINFEQQTAKGGRKKRRTVKKRKTIKKKSKRSKKVKIK